MAEKRKILPYYGNESMEQEKGFLMIFGNPARFLSHLPMCPEPERPAAISQDAKLSGERIRRS